MKRVRYIGDEPVTIISLNLDVKPDDEIDVPDDFLNAKFVEVKPKKTASTKEDA